MSVTINYGRFRSTPRGIYGPSATKSFPSSWTKKGPKRKYAYHSWRLIIWRGIYATNCEGELPPILTSLLTMKRMIVIDVDQGLLLVSLFRIKKTITIGAETGFHLPKAWVMMQWAEHSTKFPDHLSRAELRKGDFLGDSPNPHSPCIMVEQTLWKM